MVNASCELEGVPTVIFPDKARFNQILPKDPPIWLYDGVYAGCISSGVFWCFPTKTPP